MWAEIEALIPTVAMPGVFVSLAVVAYRATDGSRRKGSDDEPGKDP